MYEPISRLGFVPDIERVKYALDHKCPDRVPNFEVYVAASIRDEVLGRRCPPGVEGEVVFRPQYGYDYLYVIAPHNRPPVYSHNVQKSVTSDEKERSWADEHSALITDWASLKAYEYPEPGTLDLTEVKAAVTAARRLKGHVGVGCLMPVAPFMECQLLFGVEEFCVKLCESPDIVKALVDRIGRVGVEGMKQICREEIDFVFFGDDMAYTGGMLVGPDKMREFFFPWYRQFIEAARDAGKYIMFHSDGDIEPVIPDFISAGLHGINPIEPEAMDIVDLKNKYGRQIALIGNIDVDLLSRGTPKQIEQRVCERIKDLAPGGGYMVASSNSVCDYVKPENYYAMLKSVWEYGRYAG